MSRHDRYLIYKMLGRKVSLSSRAKSRAKRLAGVVEKVCRDVFDNAVELTVNGRLHRFDEPAAIVTEGREILFLYGGSPCSPEMEDEALFEEMRDSSDISETLDDVMKRTEPSVKDTLRFSLGERVIKPVRAFRRREQGSAVLAPAVA